MIKTIIDHKRLAMSIPEHKNFSLTKKQLEYLCYIFEYTKLHGIAPAFADIESYFKVAPSTVNQMIKALEIKGYLSKQSGVARSLKVNIPSQLLCPNEQVSANSYTKKQGRYLAFIQQYTKLHGIAPSFADIEGFFKVTSPSVNQMIKTLEKKGLIEKERGKSRSIKVLLLKSEIPTL